MLPSLVEMRLMSDCRVWRCSFKNAICKSFRRDFYTHRRNCSWQSTIMVATSKIETIRGSLSVNHQKHLVANSFRQIESVSARWAQMRAPAFGVRSFCHDYQESQFHQPRLQVNGFPRMPGRSNPTHSSGISGISNF